VGISFISPSYTENVNALGPLRIMEAMKVFCLNSKFYQASTSELFGNNVNLPYNEKTIFNPLSPYSIAKLNAYWYVNYFRNAYKMFCVNGILFNHESPRRSNDFVTKKTIEQGFEIKKGKRDKILLGNLDVKRDWGYAGDYVEAMWLMLQQDDPDDYVIATGKSFSIQDFCNHVFKKLDIDIVWEGEGKNKKAFRKDNGKVVIEVSEEFYRPIDVYDLRGDSTKAYKELGWKPKTSFDQLIDIMIRDQYEK